MYSRGEFAKRALVWSLRIGALSTVVSTMGGCAVSGQVGDDDVEVRDEGAEIAGRGAALLSLGDTLSPLLGDAAVDAAVSDIEGSDAQGLIVSVAQGRVRGKLVGETRAFLGMPYAKPPVGALRFAPPAPSEPWAGVRQALELGPVCPQPPGSLSAPGAQSEDCLTLNVYAPKVASTAKRPVMVWIHGGAFVAGGSTAYDGQKLSRAGDVVVVTLNYRLGALGLLALPALDQGRAASDPSGNDALRDQQLALAWVRANIGAFGGDAENVTLFGESAGAMSTCLHMVSPDSKGLADRYVMESGACVAGMPLGKKEEAHVVGQKLADAFCSEASDVVACLRAVPASELVAWGADQGISGAGWTPVVNADDPFLPTHPIKLILSGRHNRGAFIVGSNAREWGLFQLIGLSPKVTTVPELHAAIEAQFGPLGPLVKLQYLTLSDAHANDTFVRMMTDAAFRCPARLLARLTTLTNPSYLYSFEQGAAYHAYDIPYVFGEPNARLGAPTLVEPLRAAMQTYWTQFARTGSPNTSAQLPWPRYDLLTDRHMTLQETPSVGFGLARLDCDFWDKLYLLDT